MWYEERSDKSKKTTNPNFSICCMRGKIQLPYLKRPPQLLLDLLTSVHPRSKHFKNNIRSYNSMFYFTSIGGKVEISINDGTSLLQFITHSLMIDFDFYLLSLHKTLLLVIIFFSK